MSGVELLVLLLSVAPSLATEIIGILQKSGHVTAQEWADYIALKWPTADSFFATTPPAVKP